MKTIFNIFACISITVIGHTQSRLLTDFDGDLKPDTTFIDTLQSKIVCALSSQGFKRIESKALGQASSRTGLILTKRGFQLYTNQGRTGWSAEFKYQRRFKKIRLIGMARYELVNGQLGGGNSSINLLVNEYVGSWTIYDYQKKNLVKMPTVRLKMTMSKVFLDTFGYDVYYGYAKKCAETAGEQARQFHNSK
ncbi:hypothetical protein WSM22_24700 [Cytophagales bacterium WSM2-2]|nr:hypothetical protein WSM22_24700 [Cytophagales bacterium WSM2-2]